MVACQSPRKASCPVMKALAATNGPATVIVASNLGTTICHRGIGVSVRLARVRCSTSLPPGRNTKSASLAQ